MGPNMNGNMRSEYYRESRIPGEDIAFRIKIKISDVLYGTEKDVEYDTTIKCDTCGGTGAKDGTSFETCTHCGGTGTIIQQMGGTTFGIMQTIQTCQKCSGSGKIITKKCDICGGLGTNHKKNISRVKIPIGSYEGLRLKIIQGGNGSRNGGPNGDLYIIIQIETDPILKIDGVNINSEISIDYLQAIFGTTLEIKTIEGVTSHKIIQGTQPGDIIKLKGIGLPDFRTGIRGDQFVKVNVTIPKKLSTKEKNILSEINSDRGV